MAEVWLPFKHAAEIVRERRGLASLGDAVDLLEEAVRLRRVVSRGAVSNGNSGRRMVLDYVPELHPESYNRHVRDFREIEVGSLNSWLQGFSGGLKAATAARINNRHPVEREAAKAVLRTLPADSLRAKREALLTEVNQALKADGRPPVSKDTLRRALDEI